MNEQMREHLSAQVNAAITSLSEIKVTITATQGGEVADLFNLVLKPINDGADFDTDIEYRGEILGLLMSAYIFHKAEDAAKIMVKSESQV